MTQVSGQVQVPDSSVVFLDSLPYAQSIDSLNQYIQYLRDFSSSLRRHPLKNQIIIDTLNKYQPFREPITRAEHLSVRGWYASVLFSERKVYGDLALNMDRAMEATKYCLDPLLLDLNCLYIEQPIADFYARTDDYDRSILWYKSMIAGLKDRKDFNRLCLVYKSISKSYTFKNDLELANRYLDSMRVYLPLIDSERVLMSYKLRALIQVPFQERGNSWRKEVYELFMNSPLYKTEALTMLIDNSWGNGNYSVADSLQLINRSLVSKLDKGKLYKRELAKEELRLAKLAIETGRQDSFMMRMQRSFSCLTNRRVEEYDASLDVYPENTLVDWYQVYGDHLFNRFLSTRDIQFLHASISAGQAAITINNRIRDPILKSTSKQLSVELSRRLYDDLIERYVALYGINGDISAIEHIERTIINSNDYFLREKNTMNKTISRLPVEEQEVIERLQRELSRSQHVIYQADDSNIDSLQLELLAIRERISRLLEPYNRQLTAPEEVFPLPYLAIFRTEKSVYSLFRTSLDQVELRSMPTVEFEHHMTRFRELIVDHQSFNELEKLLGRLYHDMMPTKHQLPRRLTVFLDGAIADFPIETLRKDKRYLIQDHKISYVHSTNFQEVKAQKKANRKWLFVRPDYPADDRKFAMVDNSDRSGFFGLAFAKKEVDNILALIDEESEIMVATNIQEMDSMIGQSDIFHFAGHGKAWADSAYLVLHNSRVYQKWYASQITDQQYDLDLVTLSACETGLGRYVSGDGIQSIGRSFINAGARAVCHSLWTVNDHVTADLMTMFYHNLRQGMNKAEALQEAKLQYLSEASPEKKHPYFWAGIILQGSDEALFENSTFPRYAMLILLAILILAALFLLSKRKKQL